jgi:hypothetical protein
LNSPRHVLGRTIESLHAALNEMYAIDGNWRNVGEWPSDVEGSTLGAGATSGEIAEAESRFGHECPPSYKDFLQLHSYWKHFWGDFTLIGTGSADTQDAQVEIAENKERQTSRLRRRLGNDFSAAGVGKWEAEEERNLYLAKHLVIGTDFRGAHWVFDTTRRRADGELTLVYWDISYGAQEPMFASFYEFLDWALATTAARLEWTKQEVAKGKGK